MNQAQKLRSVHPDTYVSDYYLTTCDGHHEFNSGDGSLPDRLQLGLKHADLQPGQRILDIACGRGEVVLQAARMGLSAVGVDYSGDAVRLAAGVVRRDKNSLGRISRADGRRLPFKDGSFDRIVMFDAVEHLFPWELRLCLRETRRLLAPDGRLIIHTMPNLWYYRYGYPLFRIVGALSGKPQPADPRDRVAYQHDVHVNEQTPASMKKYLRDANLHGRVWLEPWQRYEEDGPLMRRAKSFLVRAPGLKQVFCNDIFAVMQRD
jgi:SAM-dependent methyltransferase